MMELATALPPWLPIIIGAGLLLVLPRAVGYTVAGISVATLVPLSLVAPAGAHLTVGFLGFESTFLYVDEATRLLGLGFGILGTAAVWYAYASGLSRRSGAIALAYVATTIGVVFAGDWLSMVFFWELMAITSTVLVWAYGGAAIRAGYRYAIAHGIGGSLVLFAVTWHYVAVETFAFGAIVDGIAPGGPALLAVLGIGVNCGFIGLHTWLPDTYPRPHVASSVFLSVFTTKTSAYMLFRAFPDGDLLIAYMGGLMAVYGVVFALLQHDMRALLSYHIQAQVGYMVAGIGIGSAIGIAGALGHVFNNIMYKALLFMAVGVIILRTGEHDLYRLGGLWREMPVTAGAFALGALSITAVPGTNGFISKGMLLDAADPAYYGAPEFHALYWLLMIGAVGTFLSFIKLGYYAFLHGPATVTVTDATPGQSIAMLSIGAVCIGFGVFWQAFVGILPGGEALIVEGSANPYSVGHLIDAVGLLVVSVIGFAVIRKPLSSVGHVRDVDRWLNPLLFYTGKGSMLAITELYAAVDRLVVRLVVLSYWIANNPVTTARRVGLTPADSVAANGGRPSTIPIRASIGTTVLVITVVLTLVLFILLSFT